MRPTAHKLVVLGLGLGVLAAPLAAQGRGGGRDAVPSGYEPPRGMCRIWIDGVPPGQQPAPTDCATAIKKRPSNALVVFGEPVRSLDEADRVRDRLPTRELWTPRRGINRQAGGVETPRRGQEPTSASRDESQPASRARAEQQPSRSQSEPRARSEPASTQPQASRTRSEPTRDASPRREPPPRQTPPPGEVRSRGQRTPPPPGYTDDLLARERWLDEELLASLYGDGPPGGDSRYGSMDYGRAALPDVAGERGRSRSGVDAAVPWARSVDGRALSAREVELRVRGELALVGGQYGYAGGYAGAGYDERLLEPRPGECMDRNFDGRCDDLMGGADGCADRNGDGRCDDARYDPVIDGCAPGVRCDPYTIRRGRETARAPGGDLRADAARPDRRLDGAAGYSAGFCFDRDRDGRCDEPWTSADRIPQTLPEMGSAVALRRGVPSYDVERWLRRTDAQARVTDRDGDGIPERVTWIDGAGRIVQVWTDRDGDGIADRVELFRDGLPVQVIAR